MAQFDPAMIRVSVPKWEYNTLRRRNDVLEQMAWAAKRFHDAAIGCGLVEKIADAYWHEIEDALDAYAALEDKP